MLNTKFGIEIEMTGITREKAAEVLCDFLGGTIKSTRFNGHSAYHVIDQSNRTWKIEYDGSIKCQTRKNNCYSFTTSEYSVELVSPILTYNNDIELLQNVIRQLRKAGAFTNSSAGIHIHLNGANHTATTIKNFINIVASKNDLIYRALNVDSERLRYCKKIDYKLVSAIKERKPKTLAQIEDIWYGTYGDNSRHSHYNQSRYHFLNLHSFFHGCGTVELRGFNSTLHAGKVRSYIVLALALNHQALTAKFVSTKKPQEANDKFAMRTYLNRIGLIGDEFKNCRKHLTENLDGCSAWRYGNN